MHNDFDKVFRHIFENKHFHLPKVWDGEDFLAEVTKLLEEYKNEVYSRQKLFSPKDYTKIKWICSRLIRTIKKYLNGFPADAYHCFNRVMEKLIKFPLDILNKSTYAGSFTKNVKVYRVVKEKGKNDLSRRRVFHPPYNLRTKIKTNRYSIAGFPCLYLGTSVELCLNELNANSLKKSNHYFCSRFEVKKEQNQHPIRIKVLELAVKPQDFIEKHNRRSIDLGWLDSWDSKNRYLYWYPLIAVCSFVRKNKSDPFAPEYIVPQLVLQWLRKINDNEQSKFWGLRYFSCHSVNDPDLGFNYVFPTSGEDDGTHLHYCKLLGNVFEFTKPVLIDDFSSYSECEKALNNDDKLGYFYDESFGGQNEK